MEIAAWLSGLGLERYGDTFRDNEIDMDVLGELTEADFADLGVPLGDRKRLMRGIRALDEAPTPAPSPPAAPIVEPPKDEAEAERRHLTVMFVDLVDSTRIAGDLDPEEMRDLIRAYQNVVAGEVSRFDGYVAKFMGDGVLCYFGFPTANEDDAERAVHAGKAIVKSVSRITSAKSEVAQVRIGIASGIVVVGEIIGEAEARERDVVGETPNIAARLQSVAKPGEIVIADKTNHLVSNAYRTIEVDLPDLKGISSSLRAYLALDELTLEDRRAKQNATGTEEFVGRTAELAHLLVLWEEATVGAAKSVLLTGEAGIGKSKVVQYFVDSLGLKEGTWFTLHGSPYHQQTALYPIIQVIKRGAGITPNDTDDEAVLKLKALLREFLDVHPDSGANFANLLGLNYENHFDTIDMAPLLLRARTLGQLTQFFLHRQDMYSQLVIVEDAHWLDHTTIEVLLACLEATNTKKAMFLFAGRSGAIPDALQNAVDDEVQLDRLNPQSTRAIIAELTHHKPFPTELVDVIINKTDGVPLFVRELTKMIIESDQVEETEDAFRLVGHLNELEIPSTLHDSLMARLDRLQSAKRTAQVAACIGRKFDLDVLSDVIAEDQNVVRTALDELIEAKLVKPPMDGRKAYSFKHALVCDAAYSSLLKSQRRQIHDRVARGLKSRSVSPEALAYHYERAAQPISAADCLLQAGQNALRICSAAEAINRFQHGIDLLKLDEMNSETKLLKMRLFGLLGTGYMLTKSWGAEEVQQAYGNALELVDETDNLQERIWVIWGAWVFLQVQGYLSASEPQARRAMNIALEGGQEDALLVASVIMLQTAFYKGRWAEALQHGIEIERFYDIDRHSGLKDVYSLDLLLVWYVHASQANWMLGNFQTANEYRAKAELHAKEIGHTHSRAWVAVWGANLSLLDGDAETVRKSVPGALQLCQKFGFDYVSQLGGLLLNATRLGTDHQPDVLAAMDASFEKFQGTGAGITVPYFLGFKAQALLDAGQLKDAQQACETAVQLIQDRGERWSEPFVYRIKGDILASLGADDRAQALAAYAHAIDCAQVQGALIWGLQAKLASFQLLVAGGPSDEAENLRLTLLTARDQLEHAASTTDGPAIANLMAELRNLPGNRG
ncbi:MAG: adenylate/guanylate cyclase domain-containing protein [Aliishimia sp.]